MNTSTEVSAELLGLESHQRIFSEIISHNLTDTQTLGRCCNFKSSKIFKETGTEDGNVSNRNLMYIKHMSNSQTYPWPMTSYDLYWPVRSSHHFPRNCADSDSIAPRISGPHSSITHVTSINLTIDLRRCGTGLGWDFVHCLISPVSPSWEVSRSLPGVFQVAFWKYSETLKTPSLVRAAGHR